MKQLTLLKSVRWLLFGLMTVGPLFPQDSFATQVLLVTGPIFAANALFIFSGFLTQLRYGDVSLVEYYAFRCLKTVPLMLFGTLIAIGTARSINELYYAIPGMSSLFNFYPITPFDDIRPVWVPLLPVFSSLMTCWLLYPHVNRLITSKFHQTLSISTVLALSVTMLLLSNVSFNPIQDSLDNPGALVIMFNNVLFKFPLFFAGAVIAQMKKLNLTGRWRPLAFDCWTIYLIILLVHNPEGQGLTNGILRTFGTAGVQSNFITWLPIYWAITSPALLLWLWLLHNEFHIGSLTNKLLTSEPMLTILEGRADALEAMLFKAILLLYPQRAYQETLSGKGFLLYIFILLLTCHLANWYILRGLELYWTVQTHGDYKKTLHWLTESINWIPLETDEKRAKEVENVGNEAWEMLWKIWISAL